MVWKILLLQIDFEPTFHHDFPSQIFSPGIHEVKGKDVVSFFGNVWDFLEANIREMHNTLSTYIYIYLFKHFILTFSKPQVTQKNLSWTNLYRRKLFLHWPTWKTPSNKHHKVRLWKVTCDPGPKSPLVPCGKGRVINPIVGCYLYTHFKDVIPKFYIPIIRMSYPNFTYPLYISIPFIQPWWPSPKYFGSGVPPLGIMEFVRRSRQIASLGVWDVTVTVEIKKYPNLNGNFVAIYFWALGGSRTSGSAVLLGF